MCHFVKMKKILMFLSRPPTGGDARQHPPAAEFRLRLSSYFAPRPPPSSRGPAVLPVLSTPCSTRLTVLRRTAHLAVLGIGPPLLGAGDLVSVLTHFASLVDAAGGRRRRGHRRGSRGSSGASDSEASAQSAGETDHDEPVPTPAAASSSNAPAPASGKRTHDAAFGGRNSAQARAVEAIEAGTVLYRRFTRDTREAHLMLY